jgi:hypothetical protein
VTLIAESGEAVTGSEDANAELVKVGDHVTVTPTHVAVAVVGVVESGDPLEDENGDPTTPVVDVCWVEGVVAASDGSGLKPVVMRERFLASATALARTVDGRAIVGP